MSGKMSWLPQIDNRRCNGCGDCIVQCPTGALGWEGDKAALVNPDVCIYCAACEDICPTQAIELPFLIVKAKTRKTENE